MAAGRVEQILIAGRAGELPHPVERARAVAGVGLEGDRYFAGTGTWSDWPVQEGKALTLVEAEVLEELGLSGAEARRNIVTRGVRLDELVGQCFWIGELECRGDRLCEPCTYLERLTGVTVGALAHRGGLRADILNDGEIAIGDLLRAVALEWETSRVAKKGKVAPREHWKEEPEEHDFPAAADFLSLLFVEAECAAIVEALGAAQPLRRKAKDLLRAAALPLLPEQDPEVRKDLKKVADGERLSPVLLVRGRAGGPLIVADGYHRICASYHLDEDAEIPCRLVDAP